MKQMGLMLHHPGCIPASVKSQFICIVSAQCIKATFTTATVHILRFQTQSSSQLQKLQSGKTVKLSYNSHYILLLNKGLKLFIYKLHTTIKAFMNLTIWCNNLHKLTVQYY